MSAIRTFDVMQVHGWEPTQESEDTDVSMTLGELPAGFHVERHGDETMNMMAPRRLVPPYFGSSASAFTSFPYDSRAHEACAPSSSNTNAHRQFGPSTSFTPGLQSLSPIQTFRLPTPPQTRSPSITSSPGSAQSATRAVTSSRSAAAAGVPRRHRTSTERKIERKRAENANYIPRPKNSFILFRTDFVARHKKAGEASGSTASAAAAATTAALLAAERRGGKAEAFEEEAEEFESASLSKQASEVWNRMSDEEKQPWVELAEKEKAEHARRYPNYRYRPIRSNSTTAIPTSASLPSGPAPRSGKSVSPGASGMRRTSPARTKLSEEDRLQAEWEAREREAVQKRRCDLIRDLMAQGYRGGELTNALMVLEGGAFPLLPPFGADSSPSRADPTTQIGFPTSIPVAAPENVPLASPLISSSQPQTQVPPTARPGLQRAATFTPLMSSSSSSLARALIPKTPSPPTLPTVPPVPTLPRIPSAGTLPPMPRSPSAPVFGNRTPKDKEGAKCGSPTSISCPSTPHPRQKDLESDKESPLSIASTLPTHSVPASPDVLRNAEYFPAQPQAQSAGLTASGLTNTNETAEKSGSTLGYPVYENSQSDYVSMNEFYESYDTNASLPSSTDLERLEASLAHAQASTALSQQQRPLDAVAAMWTRTQPDVAAANPVTSFEGPSFVASAGQSSWGAALGSSLAPASTQYDAGEDRLRPLTGLPSPPSGPQTLPENSQQAVLHHAQSLGNSASQSTDVDIEAYHLGLGHALSSNSSSSSISATESNYSFMLDNVENGPSCFEYFDLDLGTVLPESTLSYSALGLSYGDNGDEFRLDDFFERSSMRQASGEGGHQHKNDYDDYARFIRTP